MKLEKKTQHISWITSSLDSLWFFDLPFRYELSSPKWPHMFWWIELDLFWNLNCAYFSFNEVTYILCPACSLAFLTVIYTRTMNSHIHRRRFKIKNREIMNEDGFKVNHKPYQFIARLQICWTYIFGNYPPPQMVTERDLNIISEWNQGLVAWFLGPNLQPWLKWICLERSFLMRNLTFLTPCFFLSWGLFWRGDTLGFPQQLLKHPNRTTWCALRKFQVFFKPGSTNG